MRCFIWLLAAAGCSASNGADVWRGFPEQQVAVARASAEPVDNCGVRTGRLVVEIAEVLIREYPNFGSTPKGSGQRPLLIVLLDARDHSPAKSEAAVWIAPRGYQPGQTVDSFLGQRILDRPSRHLAHRRLVVRVLENDSTTPPEWVEVARKISMAAPIGSMAGVSVPGAVIADGSWLIAQLDPDDLVMFWNLDLDSLIAQLGTPAERRALRLHGVTPRPVGGGSSSAPPTAEMRLLVYREPEPGCPAPAVP